MEIYKQYINKHYRLTKVDTYSVNGIIHIKDFDIIDLETNEEMFVHHFYDRIGKILDIDDRLISNILKSISFDVINDSLSNQLTIDYGTDSN